MKPLHECHVLVTPTSYGRHNPALRTDLEQVVGRVTYNESGKPLTAGQLAPLLAGVDGYIAGLDEINSVALAAADGLLQVIARYGVGVNNVDLVSAQRKGIVVTNTPGANARAVAELTMGLMLNLLRPIVMAAEQTRGGGWPRTRGLSLTGKTVGLVGLGVIGKEVARRLVGFDCRVLAHDVAPDAVFAAAHAVELIALPDLLARADIVSLHLPAVAETRSMINANFLGQMKRGSFLINTARGELVDETALIAALQEERLLGVALDAFCQEPPPVDSPLLQLPQVIPTPHMGAHTDEATNAMGQMALANCLAVLRGQEPPHRVV